MKPLTRQTPQRSARFLRAGPHLRLALAFGSPVGLLFLAGDGGLTGGAHGDAIFSITGESSSLQIYF